MTNEVQLDPPPDIYALAVDRDHVVNRTQRSNVLPAGFIAVSPEIYREANEKLGRCKFLDGALTDYEPPVDAALQPALNRQQLPQAFAEKKIIPWAEAEDWATGEAVPCFVSAALGAKPEEERARTRLFLLTAPVFPRLHPASLLLADALAWDAATYTTFWHFAATL